MKKWRRFEKLVAQVQKDLSPNVTVLWNQRIIGKKSNTKRQIDILVKQKVGQFEMLIAIDCKDVSRPIDLKEVEETIGLFQDIQANKGAIVSVKGFSDAAKNVAKDAGIDLFCLIDSGDHDWKTLVKIPILFDYRILKKFSYVILGPIPNNFDCAKPQDLKLFSKDFDYIGTIKEILIDMWKNKKLPSDKGDHKKIKIINEVLNIKFNDKFVEVNILVNFTVERQIYLQMLPLEKISGFEDQIKGRIITTGFTTDAIDLTKIKENSKKITNTEELAITPIFCFEVFTA